MADRICCLTCPIVSCFIFCAITGELEGIGPLVSSLKPEKKEHLLGLLDAKTGDLILFALGKQSTANRILGRLRLFIAHKLDVIDTVSPSNWNIFFVLMLWIYSVHVLMGHGIMMRRCDALPSFIVLWEQFCFCFIHAPDISIYIFIFCMPVSTFNSLGDRFSNVWMEQWWTEIWGQFFFF